MVDIPDGWEAIDDPRAVSNSQAAEPKKKGFNALLSGLETGVKSRALGLLQTALEASGNADSAIYQDTTDLAKKYQAESEGTGFAGGVGEVLGDPLTYLPLGVAGTAGKTAATIKNLAKVGGVAGFIAGGTNPISGDESRLENAAKTAAISTVAAPILGKTIEAVGKSKPVKSAVESVGKALADDGGYVGGSSKKVSDSLSSAESFVYRTLVGEMGMTHQQAIDAIQMAGKAKAGEIPLSLPEAVDSSALLKSEKALRQTAGKAGDIEAGFLNSRKDAIPSAIDRAASKVGKIRPIDVAGENASNAAKQVFENLKASRKSASSALYEKGYSTPPKLRTKTTQSIVSQDTGLFDEFGSPIQKLVIEKNKSVKNPILEKINEDPLTASIYKKMQGSPRVQSRLKDYPQDSLGWVNEARKEASGLADQAKRSGNTTEYRDYTIAANRFREIIDKEGGATIQQANKAFAEASEPINEAEQSLVGVLAEMEKGDVHKASIKLFSEGTTPNQIRYARKMIRGTNPQAWDDLIASHLSYVGDKVNHSPVKFLNAIGDRLANGSVYRADKFSAALSKDQKKTIDVLSRSLERASRIKTGSDTFSNIKAGEALDRELSGGVGGVEAIKKGVSLEVKQLGLEAYAWVRGKVMAKRYEELAKIFTGQGSDEFVAKLSKMDPKGNQVYREIIDRIAAIEASGASSVAASKVADPVSKGMVMDGKEQPNTQSAPPQPKLTIPDGWEAIKDPRNPEQGASLDPNIMQDEGLRHAAYMDTTGNRTIGYGFNMDSGIAKKVWQRAGIPVAFNDVYDGKAAISSGHALALGAASQDIAREDAQAFTPMFHKLSPARQEALTNLSYQLGANRLGEFKKFKAALDSGKFALAARELIDSDWWDQTQDSRKRRIIQQIMQG